MDLGKIKPEKIKTDAVDKIDDFENDQLGALKQRRVWLSMRDEVVKALRQAEAKIARAKAMKKPIKRVAQLAKEIRGAKKEEAKKKSSKNLKEFMEQYVGQFQFKKGNSALGFSRGHSNSIYNKYGFDQENLKVEDLEAIKEFVAYAKGLVKKDNKDVHALMDVWTKALDKTIADWPRSFDDYGKEVVSEILDALFELEDTREEKEKYMDKVDLVTSPMNDSDFVVAKKVTPPLQTKGDYEKY